MTRCVLLLGTPKGAFILEGDQRIAATGGSAARSARAGRSTTSPSTPRRGALLAGAGSPWYGPAVWRSDDLGETWTHSSEGLTYGDEGPKVATVWNVTAGLDGASTRVSSPPGCSGRPTAGATWSHVEGLTNHPTPGGVGSRRRRPDPAHDRPPPHRPGANVGRHLGGRACSRPATAARPGRPGTRASAPTSIPRSTPSSASASTSSSSPRATASGSTSRTTAASTAPRTAAWPGTRSPTGCRRDFGFVDGGPPARPDDRLEHPAHRARAGTLDARRQRRRSGGPTTAATTWIRSGEGLPQADAYIGVLREAMAVDRLDPVGVYFGTSTGQLYGIGRRGPDLDAARGQPAADLVGGGARRWLRPGGREPRPRVVHLPRSLVALFPGAERPAEARGATVAGGHRGPRPPGAGPARTGVLDAGPAIRTHLNVFVNGERATVTTPVPPGAEVHVIPAVSGG